MNLVLPVSLMPRFLAEKMIEGNDVTFMAPHSKMLKYVSVRTQAIILLRKYIMQTGCSLSFDIVGGASFRACQLVLAGAAATHTPVLVHYAPELGDQQAVQESMAILIPFADGSDGIYLRCYDR